MIKPRATANLLGLRQPKLLQKECSWPPITGVVAEEKISVKKIEKAAHVVEAIFLVKKSGIKYFCN